MIICDSRQFVFIHNPKCAGTSVRSALQPYDTTGLLFARHDTWNGYKVETTHLPLFMMQVAYPTYFEKLRTHFTFMAVRNPFTRFVSAFNEVNEETYTTYGQSADPSRYRYELNRFASNLNADALAGWHFDYRHFVRQVDFAFVGRKNYVDALIRVEAPAEGYDRVGLFDAEIAELLRQAPKRRQRPLALPLGDLLDATTIDKIRTLYAHDFTAFGYDMRLPDDSGQ